MIATTAVTAVTAATIIDVPIALAGPQRPAADVLEESSRIGDAEVGVSDGDIGRAIVFGLTVGTVGMFLVSFLICIAAGLAIGTALGVAVLPAVFAGLYGGGVPFLTAHMVRSEKRERELAEQ